MCDLCRVCVFHSNQSITVGKFNTPGDIFAYALSYDWSMGSEKYNPSQPSVIRLHSVQEAEIKQKKKPGIGQPSGRNSF